jgi:hypothetical protein
MSWFDYWGYWPWNADDADEDEEFDDDGVRRDVH